MTTTTPRRTRATTALETATRDATALDMGSIALPIGAITQTTAILGIRDSGKTNTAAVYAEELLKNNQQVVIIDPTDAWWGLKSSSDGKHAGYAVVVLGGKHSDLALDAGDGAVIADFVVEQRASVICCLRHFESKADELRFVTAFLRRLYYLKGQQDAPTPLALIIDEASRMIPQRVLGEDTHCVGAVQQIVRQGRSSGFGIVLIDQRASSVNKDVLDMLELLIMHRTTGPRDRKALRDWIEAHDTEDREKEFLGSLASLKRGEAWFWSPGWLDLFRRVQVRARRTFDSSATPRAGAVAIVPEYVATVDLDALRAKLTTTIERAKANDPGVLRERIVQLEREVATQQPIEEYGKAELKDEYERGYGDGAIATAQQLHEQLRQHFDRAVHGLSILEEARSSLLNVHTIIGAEWTGVQELARDLISREGSTTNDYALAQRYAKQALEHASAGGTIGTKRAPLRMAQGGIVEQRDRDLVPVVLRNSDESLAARNNNGSSSSIEQTILDAHAFLARVGHTSVPRLMLAAFCRYHPRTPTFGAALRAVEASGDLVKDGAARTSLSRKGARRARNSEPTETRDDVRRAWFARLTELQAKILTALIEGSRSREGLAAHLNYHPRTPTFGIAIKWLRAVGLITQNGKTLHIDGSVLYGTQR